MERGKVGIDFNLEYTYNRPVELVFDEPTFLLNIPLI